MFKVKRPINSGHVFVIPAYCDLHVEWTMWINGKTFRDDQIQVRDYGTEKYGPMKDWPEDQIGDIEHDVHVENDHVYFIEIDGVKHRISDQEVKFGVDIDPALYTDAWPNAAEYFFNVKSDEGVVITVLMETIQACHPASIEAHVDFIRS